MTHAKEEGYAVTLFGRRRPIPELKSSNFMQRNFGERVAMNAPIQGTAADIMKIAMIGVNRELKEKRMKSRMILQVHDELLIETHPDEIETVKEILKRQMETAASLDVPLIADMQVGKTGTRQNSDEGNWNYRWSGFREKCSFKAAGGRISCSCSTA